VREIGLYEGRETRLPLLVVAVRLSPREAPCDGLLPPETLPPGCEDEPPDGRTEDREPPELLPREPADGREVCEEVRDVDCGLDDRLELLPVRDGLADRPLELPPLFEGRADRPLEPPPRELEPPAEFPPPREPEPPPRKERWASIGTSSSARKTIAIALRISVFGVNIADSPFISGAGVAPLAREGPHHKYGPPNDTSSARGPGWC